MGEAILAKEFRCRLNNDVQNSQVIFYLCRVLARCMHDILRVDNRISPRKLVELIINRTSQTEME